MNYSVQHRPQFSVKNFAKFRAPVCKILWLTMAKSSKFSGLPFLSKLSYTLYKNFSFWRADWHSDWVMLAMYKENYLSFFALTLQSVKLCCTYLWLCHTAIAISRAHSYGQFSLIFTVIKIPKSYKSPKNFQFLQNSAKISKFHVKGNIMQLGSKFRGPQKTVGPTVQTKNSWHKQYCRHEQ